MNTNPNSRKPSVPDSISKEPRKPGNDDVERPDSDGHEGATDEQVGDTTGPGVGYDQEPAQETDKGGVADS